MPKQFFDYIDSGAYTEGTYNANEADFKKITFRQRVAVNLENRNLGSTLLGQPVSLPVAIAPVGSTGMTDADGEIKAARAAEKFGIPFTLSTMAICSIEDVAENTTQAVLVPALRDEGPGVHRAADRSRQGGEMLGAGADDGPADPRAAPQGRPQRADWRRRRFTPKFVAEMAIKPGWALRMLGTKRRTFRNIAGHVKDAVNLAVAEQMDQTRSST